MPSIVRTAAVRGLGLPGSGRSRKTARHLAVLPTTPDGHPSVISHRHFLVAEILTVDNRADRGGRYNNGIAVQKYGDQYDPSDLDRELVMLPAPACVRRRCEPLT